MTIETLKEAYPKLYERLPDDISGLCYLLVINVNYHHEDLDEEGITKMVLSTLEEIAG